jgi:branched-chain amino acid transport system substrate-binding protein
MEEIIMKRKILVGNHLLAVIFLLVLSLTLLLGRSFANAEQVRGVTNDTIKIGYILDMTGPATVVTVPMSKAFRDYFKHVNDEGGINGRKVTIIGEDDRYSIPLGIASFKKLVFRDGVLTIYGVSNSATCMAMFSQVAREKLPILAAPMASTIVNPTKRYWFNRGGTYEDEVKIMFDYVMKDSKAKKKSPRIGFVCANNEYGNIGLRAVEERERQYNTKLVDIQYVPMTALEASSNILNLKINKADYVILHHTVAPVICVLRDARKLGYNPTFIAGVNGWGEEVVEMAGKAAENTVGIHAVASWYDDCEGIVNLRKIVLKLHPGTEKPMRSKHYTQGWVSAIVYTEALKRAGKNLSGETLVNALETFRNFDTGGLCAPITYTPDNHKASEHFKFFKPDLVNNRLIAITGWEKPIEME